MRRLRYNVVIRCMITIMLTPVWFTIVHDTLGTLFVPAWTIMVVAVALFMFACTVAPE